MNDREAFRRKFGHPAPESFPDLGGLLTHRSVRRFVPGELPAGHLDGLIAAAQSSSTSSNLHCWSAVAIQAPENRLRASELCNNQVQVRDAGVFFAFLADLSRLKAAVPDTTILESCEMYTMAVVDAAIAAERAAVAAERLGLGICYIGALRDRPNEVIEWLGLPLLVFPLFGLAVGIPAADDISQVKPRISPSSIVFSERYDPHASVEEYDARHAEFATIEGMRGPGEWSKRIIRRLSEDALGSRATQLDHLRAAGFLKR